jgi:transcriptional regulator of acetoin/glycerol metabolism
MSKESTRMGLQSNALETAHAGQLPPLGGDNGLSSETIDDLELVREKRTNLLVIGNHAATRAVLEELRLGPRETVVTWRPGQALELPPPGRANTMILHDVDQLTVAAQSAVLRWLDQSVGRIWVVSTSTEPLWPQVESGAFSDTLYYRLNIVCVRVPEPDED